MIILHAGFYDDTLLLWGETPTQSAVTLPKRRGRKPKIPRPEPFPYDPGDGQLKEALLSAGLDFIGNGVEPLRAIAWLPTVRGIPAASSLLIAKPPDARVKSDLQPWEVSALSLPSAVALELLCTCVDKHLLCPGVVISNDLAFWTAAMRFAGALAARQHFLPGIVHDDDVFYARWEPVFVGADIDHLAGLAKRMPHVSRALTIAKNDTPPDTPARTVLTRFVNQIVDNIVRSSTSSPDVLPELRRGRKKRAPRFPSIHEQWLHALHTPDGMIEGDPGELAQLARQIGEWRRPIHITSTAPFRLCFKLEEPEMDSDITRKIDTRHGTWKVTYLLQASDDPSLFVTARDAFNNRKRTTRAVFKRYGFNAREYLLFTLGQAASICSRIETSLQSPTPHGYETDEAGAFEFLTETGMALQNAGFVVLYPAWWTGKGSKRRLTAQAKVKSPKMTGGGGLTLDTILAFNWEIALGDEKLTLRELQQLAKLKAPLVRVRGEWIQLDPSEIQSAIDSWKFRSDEASLRELVQMALGAAPTAAGIPLEGIKATGWIKRFFAELEGLSTPEELATPQGFHGTLRPYQSRGFSWLQFLRQWGLGACLADDMGLGKTIQALALIEHDREAGNGKPVLLICPTSVIGNWRMEAERFTPDLPVMVHHGVDRLKDAKFKKQVKKSALVVSSYALLHRDFDTFKQIDWAGVILDEAQNIKNPDTKQAKSARSLKADYRIAMTGTPVENNVGDLWSIMEFLNPGFLGSQNRFKRNFFIPIQTGRDPRAADRLKRITGPFILRRLKTDKKIISDLPEKIENKVYCPLTKEQASLYEAVAEDALESLRDSEGIQRKGLVLATLMKLKQVCNHPAQFLGDNSPVANRSGKLTRLTEMLEEMLATGDRALLFTQFKEMGGILQGYLQETFGREVLFLHGSVTKSRRDMMIERFQSDGAGPDIFILSLKAGGTGLNLTRANHVFHFDRWWNPAVENQATDRAFRIGQTRNVMVHKFLCLGTLEERIDEMIEHKKEIASKVVGTGEGWLTELSTAELKELFTLRREAVGE